MLLIGTLKTNFSKILILLPRGSWVKSCTGHPIKWWWSKVSVDFNHIHGSMTRQKQASAINQLWPTDTVQCHKNWSTLVWVIGCCKMALTYYLNQCWSIISGILLYSSQVAIINSWYYIFKVTTTSLFMCFCTVYTCRGIWPKSDTIKNLNLNLNANNKETVCCELNHPYFKISLGEVLQYSIFTTSISPSASFPFNNSKLWMNSVKLNP